MRQFRSLGAVTLLIFTLWFIPSTGAHKEESSEPTIAVLQFVNKAGNQWMEARWRHRMPSLPS